MTDTFRPTGPAPAKIMIVGDCPSVDDERTGMPFSGYTGDELGRMLQEAGILRGSCFVTHVLRIRPPGSDPSVFVAMKKNQITAQHGIWRDKQVLPPVWEGASMLAQEISLVRPNLIIALGNMAMFALTGEWGITSWRGSVLECNLQTSLDYQPKVIPAYAPVMVMRQWSLRSIMVHDLRRAAREAKSAEIVRPDYNFIIRPDIHAARFALQGLLAACAEGPTTIAGDIETRAGHIACIGFAWSKTDAICLPLMCVERAEGYWTADEEAEVLYLVWKLTTHENIRLVGQNFIYDSQYFWWHLHYCPPVARDTMLAQHSMFSNQPKGLDYLSSMHCEYHRYWKDDGKEWDEKTGEDQLWRYNCEDAVRTYEVDVSQQSAIDKMKLREVHDFQQSLIAPVLKTMNRGLRVDFGLRSEFAMSLDQEISDREQWLTEVLGRPINIKSPKQMQELFYDELGQQPIISRKTLTVTTDDEALGKIASREPLLRPLIAKVQELRSLGVFLSTFVRAPVGSDGRMRCSFNIGGTETYRFSSSQDAFGSGLNLQNIPNGSAGETLDLPNIRKLFVPDPGNTFFDIDLSSADLRIVVWESDEQEFKAMLREGLDPYTEIAKEFYGDPSITKKDPRRQTFKGFAHGTNYLGTAKGLAERLGLSVHEAEKTQKWYFSRFPRIKKWQENLKDQVLKRRMVENVFGYRQYFFDRIEGTIFNQAAAWIPQSTVACLINRGYVNIDKNLPQVEVLLQVHDSLAGQFPSYLGDWAVREIVKQAEIPLPYDDPMTIPVGVKTSPVSWGHCK